MKWLTDCSAHLQESGVCQLAGLLQLVAAVLRAGPCGGAVERVWPEDGLAAGSHHLHVDVRQAAALHIEGELREGREPAARAVLPEHGTHAGNTNLL